MTNAPKRVLLVLTSHGDLGGVRETGYYVGEAAHPWQVFRDAGLPVDIASVKGGRPPEDGRDESDPAQREFLTDPDTAAKLADTKPIRDVRAEDYTVVYFVGGHGTMWDFPGNEDIARVASGVYTNGGVVAAVCHGPAALVDVRLPDGGYLVDGKTVTSFTNDEEAAVGLTDTVPFLLADKLAERGAKHVPAADFTDHVEVDERLVTGQNPQSAASVARRALELIEPA